MSPASEPGPEISAVLPIRDEEAVLERAVTAVGGELSDCAADWELICVDDGSSDETPAILTRLAAEEPRLRVVSLARGFGKEAALAAGLDSARGRAVVLLDADLQHPPALIPRLVERWREGFDVVDAVKTSRDGGPVGRLAAGLFNRLIGRAVSKDFRGASDYKLLDRQVVDALRACPERQRFFRGLVAWVGFRVATVPFAVDRRTGGRSKWSTTSLVAYSLRNLVSFTSLPLRLIAWLGFATVAAGALLGAQTLWNWWRGVAVSGFTTVILSIVLFSGLILFTLGVIALYVAAIYDEQKGRPLYVVRRDPDGRAAAGGGSPPASAAANASAASSTPAASPGER